MTKVDWLDPVRSPLAWRNRIDILSDEAFDTEYNRIRNPRDAYGRMLHDCTAAHCMAGWAFRPTFVEFAEAIARSEQTQDERAYLKELIQQMDPYALRGVVHHSGASVFQVARAMRNSGINHPFYANWINGFAVGYRTPEPLAGLVERWFDPGDNWGYKETDWELTKILV